MVAVGLARPAAESLAWQVLAAIGGALAGQAAMLAVYAAYW